MKLWGTDIAKRFDFFSLCGIVAHKDKWTRVPQKLMFFAYIDRVLCNFW